MSPNYGESFSVRAGKEERLVIIKKSAFATDDRDRSIMFIIRS